MSYDAILAELVDGLQAAGRENFNAADSDEAMERIAEPIARAICDGVDFSIKGTATVAEINAMQDMEDGDTWAVTDAGTITNSDETTVEVTAGDLVRWDGKRWVRFLHIDLTGYVTDAELAAAIAAVQAVITAHASRTDNPHQVTAAQVGAATPSYVDTAVGAEATIRGNADDALQQQIDANRIDVDENLDSSSTNPVENRAVAGALDSKQDQLTEMTDQEVNDLINSL